jgi:tetratricopeptide (TPR) repeat protein
MAMPIPNLWTSPRTLIASAVLGRNEEALATLGTARLDGGSDVALRASIDLARGAIHAQRGELRQAEEIYRAVLASDLPENDPQVALALSGLGWVERIRGGLEEALRDHQLALARRETAEDENGVAASCVNLGNVYCDLGRYEEAERAYRRAVPILEAKGLKNFLIYALSGLGNVHFRTDRKRAAESYEKALRLCQETGNRSQLGVLHYNLGEIALDTHRYSEALREFELSFGILDAVGRRSGEAEARSRKAKLHRILGELVQAEEELARAAAAAETTGSRRDRAGVHLESARIGQTRGDPSRAKREVEEALGLLPPQAERPMRLQCARVLLALGDLDRGRREVQEAASDPQILSESGTRCLLEHLRGLASGEIEEARLHLEEAVRLSSTDYEDLPLLLSDLAWRSSGEAARKLHERALEVLGQRAAGIADAGRRQWFLSGDPSHKELAARARKAGVPIDR